MKTNAVWCAKESPSAGTTRPACSSKKSEGRARAYGREGFTVIIHGKHEHEETKATFSNTQQSAPAVIVRHLEEARLLGRIIASDSPEERAQFYTTFAGRYTPGFDVDRDLERIAAVNQTTLLMNETVAIIEHLRDVYRAKYGDPDRVGGKQRRDTLCYATQVNQDALSRALNEPLDAALVIGGKNSSNTYQLYRLCADQLGDQAHFIQSEACLLSSAKVTHYVFPSANHAGPRKNVNFGQTPAIRPNECSSPAEPPAPMASSSKSSPR